MLAPLDTMTALLLFAPALALAVLAAHFYRAAAWPLLLACVLLIALLGLRRAWVARLLPWLLLAGSLEWLWTTVLLVQQRLALDQAWQRLALILGLVALLMAASALVFRSERLRRYYRLA